MKCDINNISFSYESGTHEYTAILHKVSENMNTKTRLHFLGKILINKHYYYLFGVKTGIRTYLSSEM